LLCDRADEDDPRLREEHHRSTAEHIRAYGRNSLGLATEGDRLGWAFTIGLWHSFGSPEVSIRRVVHDHDGDWQFHDGVSADEADMAIVHLKHIISAHPHVAEFASLPLGPQVWQQEDGSWMHFGMAPELVDE
jgi:hypothetical protein